MMLRKMANIEWSGSPRGALLLALLCSLVGHTAFAGEPVKLLRGAFTENVITQRDPNQTYTLYLPGNYSPDRKWPVLLVFDPRQRGTFAAELFREAAEKYGWILVSSNQTRSDGPMKPNLEAVNALWPEVNLRFASDPRRLYASGFSGGAMLALAMAPKAPLAGVIAAGGRLAGNELEKPPRFAHFGAAGINDFNYLEMREIDDIFALAKAPHRFEPFNGPHQWMPKELAAAAIEWMELLAMRDGLRPPDQSLIREVLSREMARGERLEREEKWIEVARLYGWVSATFEGLADVTGARARQAAVDRDPRTFRQRRAEKRAFDYERQLLPRLHHVLVAMADPDALPGPAGKLRAELRLDELRARVAKGSFEGAAAQRILESLFVQASFYLYRDAVEKSRFPLAATYLGLAEELKPGTPLVAYNLACALARSGEKKKALAALSRSVTAGFRDVKQLTEDSDLASLRDEPAFREVVATMSR